MKKNFRNRGLPSLNDAAVDRRRQLVTGRARVGGGIPPKLFLWGLGFLIVSGFFYFRHFQAELEEQRGHIFEKQRATLQLLGPKLLPLRDEIEGYVRELSQPGAEFVKSGVDFSRVLSAPSIYLRIRLEDTRAPETLRQAAAESLRDGFTSCLLRDPNAPSMTAGPSCQKSTDCQPGELCNEFGKCSRPSSPYNMRLLYKGLLVLSDEWTQEVREAGTDTKLIAYERSLDSVTKADIPIAIDVHQRAKYAVVVVDEDPQGGLPAPYSEEFESPAERVRRVAHDARVGIWDLKNDEMLARINGRAEGELRATGTAAPSRTPSSEAAAARLAHSCGLALGVKAKLLAASPPSESANETTDEAAPAAPEQR